MTASKTLQNEHVLINRIAAAAAKGLERLNNGESLPEDFIRKCVDFFREYVVNFHFPKEENDGMLFEEMEKAGIFTPDFTLEEFKLDHRLVREYLDNIEKIIENFDESDKDKIRILTEYLDKLIKLLERHSRRENRVLYPMGDRMISGKIENRLNEGFEKINRNFGDYQDKYGKMADEFEKFLKNQGALL